MTQPEPPDELLLRYRQASAQDTSRPAERVRAAVRAHALAVVAAHRQDPAAPAARRDVAANQSRWKMSALASVALVGLTGLLLLQFDRGTPAEKELVQGSAVVDASPAPQALPPATSFPATVDKSQGALPAARAPEPESRLRVDPSRGSVRSKSDPPGATTAPAARDEPVQPMPSSPGAGTPPALAVANEAVPAAPAAKLADKVAAPVLPSGRVEADDAAVLAPAPPARVTPGARGTMAQEKSGPMPGARGTMAQEQSGASAQPALRQRDGERMARDPTVALRDIARAGDVSPLAQLIGRGAALDGADEAGQTPLMLAVINGHTEMVRRLLAAGANPLLQDRDHMTALAHARRLGLDAIARMLEARR